MCLELGYRGANILLGTPLGTENGSWVIIMTSDQYFYVTPGDASPGVGYSVGSGISDGKANPSHQFYSFGIVSGVLSRLSKRCTSANVSSLGRESSIPVSSEFDLLRFVDAAHASYIPLRGSGFGFLLKS